MREIPLLSSNSVCGHCSDQQGETDTSPLTPPLTLAQGTTTTVSMTVPQALFLHPQPLIFVPLCVGPCGPMATSFGIADSKPFPSEHFHQVLPLALKQGNGRGSLCLPTSSWGHGKLHNVWIKVAASGSRMKYLDLRLPEKIYDLVELPELFS